MSFLVMWISLFAFDFSKLRHCIIHRKFEMDPNTLAETMMKSEYLVSKYSDTIMVYSNTMGIMVIVDYLLPVTLQLRNISLGRGCVRSGETLRANIQTLFRFIGV